MFDKTQPTWKQTKFGLLSVHEIEQNIFSNVILVQRYIYINYKTLEFSIETLCKIHTLLAQNLFDSAGIYRTHNVQIGNFEPIPHFQVPIEMKVLGDNIAYRLPLLTNHQEKKEFLAEIMRKILWIHPFFDYNARVTRLFAELFLLQMQMPVSSFRGASRKDFAEAMKKATFVHDFSMILKLI